MSIMSTETRRPTKPAAQVLERTYNWRDDAACARTDPETFYPQGHSAQAMEQAAKRVCAGCFVREDCLDFALATDQHTGVWGGLSEVERRGRSRSRENSFVRCLEAQEFIEERRAAGAGMRELARAMGVSYELMRRVLAYFEAERQQASAVAEEVAAA
jgi:WhiB family redox-sensing transcriptional regulator